MTGGGKDNVELFWREPILRHFSADIARACRVTVVADPDGLLRDDLIATRLQEFGFDVVQFDDPVKFRFVYETQHRRRWDNGEHASIVVSAPCDPADLNSIPHDVLGNAQCAERVLSVSLADLFDGMSATVLSKLDTADLDLLWEVRPQLRGETLGVNQTRDFVLRAVFKLSPEIITRADELAAALARMHHAGRVVPEEFADRFAEVAAQSGRFADWPLSQFVASADAYFTFLQERWHAYLAMQVPDALDPFTDHSLPGPAEVQFDSNEVRTILDNLFVEGRLTPIPVRDPTAFEGRWERIGIAGISSVGSTDSLRQLIQQLNANVPEPRVPPTVWTSFAMKWGELIRQFDSLGNSESETLKAEQQILQETIDQRLHEWIEERFAALANRSYLPTPIMVHQIPHFIAHRRSPNDRIALVVVDGMSISQWMTIRDAPGPDWRHGLRIEESALFAWIPTITCISRQSIFAGQVPMFFESTLLSTHAEERHWKTFWEEKGWKRDAVGLIKHRNGEPEAALISRTRLEIEDQRVTVLGVVINSVDHLVHGVGSQSVLHASVQQWGRDGHLASLLTMLIERGFDVFIASDHGNISARGVGRLDVGTVPDERGLRAMLFADANTRDTAIANVSQAFAWPPFGLPKATSVALAGGHAAFSTTGSIVRSHGGASIDELLVPFVKVVQA